MNKEKLYYNQLFKDYPNLKYFAIHGPRDKSFVAKGEINPLIVVRNKLAELNIEFNYIENYTAI